MSWMIYGANGYTGKLTAEEAVKRGLKPVLAGRNEDTIRPLAESLGLTWRAFGLDNADALRHGLDGISTVLHCAGPFSATCEPMLEACLENQVNYLDITGEISVFAHCHAQHERAVKRGIVVLPGAGFDVVPTDCLAALIKRDMPDATELVLAFEGGGGFSPGTAKTSVEGLGSGGRVRKNGEVKKVPLAWKWRYFTRDGEQRSAMTIPWGDVYTAYVSTGIPDIEVYMAAPPSTIKRLRRMRLLGPLLGTGPVQRFLKAQVDKKVRGPSEKLRGKTDSFIWGEARDASGHLLARQLRTPNGYELTVNASLGIVARLEDGEAPEPGYYTPSRLMGADYVLGLPGVTLFR
ncbi:MAG: saccharopine dehydrogenase NADP-binding domain-containing protein [Xanthomonadaceae bacterium]|nr:saccharopine dehydrogenase NADP-binding domain-containing protein [Xanthomonadaceae bacterium]